MQWIETERARTVRTTTSCWCTSVRNVVTDWPMIAVTRTGDRRQVYVNDDGQY